MSEKSELIPVANTENPSRSADVIFVHGLKADPCHLPQNYSKLL